MLNGQKLQGPLAALEVHKLLKASNNEKKLVTVIDGKYCYALVIRFPLMTAVYKICYEDVPVEDLLSMI